MISDSPRVELFWPQIGKGGFEGRMILKRAARVSVEKREGEGRSVTGQLNRGELRSTGLPVSS